MRKIIFLFLNVAILLVLVNWGAPETTVAGGNKHVINFHGTLYTWAQPEQPIKIDNISLDNLFRQIPLYTKPSIKNKKIIKKEGNNYIILKNPRKNFTEIQIDLSETNEIIVPQPEKKWTYKPEENKTSEYGNIVFVEIILVSNDKKTQSHYLIENNKKLYCDKINKAGPIEMEVPIIALKKLVIEGFTDRNLEKKKQLSQENRKEVDKFMKTKKQDLKPGNEKKMLRKELQELRKENAKLRAQISG